MIPLIFLLIFHSQRMNTVSYIVLIIDLEKWSNIIFKINLYMVFPFLKIFYYFNYLYICICTDECRCPRGQRYEILLEWEFQAGVSCLMWVLVIELILRKSSIYSEPQSCVSGLFMWFIKSLEFRYCIVFILVKI